MTCHGHAAQMLHQLSPLSFSTLFNPLRIPIPLLPLTDETVLQCPLVIKFNSTQLNLFSRSCVRVGVTVA